MTLCMSYSVLFYQTSFEYYNFSEIREDLHVEQKIHNNAAWIYIYIRETITTQYHKISSCICMQMVHNVVDHRM